MRKLVILPLLFVVALSTAGCQTFGGPKQTFGTLAGAGLGGWLGSTIGGGTGRLIATGAGVLLGAALGGEIGASMDEVDRMKANQALNTAYAAPLGSTVEWNNPNSGNSGSFTPRRDGTDRNTGAYCREYTTTVNIGGRAQTGVGTACRNPDGTWRIVNGN
ncbi:MAG: glycine zipper 2TM domain-containing protein [Proteobacteria bacterium]|nr:glycine zipper 2TM domain-containing protein [Pseudomonadota bacterium]